MRTSIKVGTGTPVDITDYPAFSAWVDTLDAKRFPEVVHLREYGWSQELDELMLQLGEADPTGIAACSVDSIVRALAARDELSESCRIRTELEGYKPEAKSFRRKAAGDFSPPLGNIGPDGKAGPIPDHVPMARTIRDAFAEQRRATMRKWMRIEGIEFKDQARVPAGSPEGGEFAGGGGDRSSVRSRRAVIGEMHPAEKVGGGKNSQIVMADGTPAPAHIKPGMIPPAYAHNIQVSKDPDADVWARSEDADGNVKPVYNPKFVQSNQDVKWGRVQDGVDKMPAMREEIQSDRSGPQKNEADAAYLMSEQATRPGSEEDTKGNSHLWAEPVNKSNFEVTPGKRPGDTPGVKLKVGGETIPIRDEGARAEIVSRIKSGKSLEDAGYWIKSHGATTLEGRHVIPTGDGGAKLQFMGKEGVWHDHTIQDPKLAAMLLDRKVSAGDNGSLFGTNYGKVSQYVSDLDGGKFSPKDLRTIRANEIARETVGNGVELGSEKARDSYIKQVDAKVSRVLGNRPQQAHESYIDGRIWSKVTVKQ